MKSGQIPKILGCRPDEIDERDYVFIAGATPPDMPSFLKGYDTEERYFKLRDDDQKSTYGCVTYGGTNDCEMTVFIATKESGDSKIIHLSQRDAYSQIYVSGGGASPRTYYKLAQQKGVCEDNLMPTIPPNGNLTENWLRTRNDASDKTIENALKWRIGEYLAIYGNDFNVIAQAIFENGGVGCGYLPIGASMGHFIFFKGYGMHEGCMGIKYKDSIPNWVGGKKVYDKWIVERNQKFYLDNPLGREVRLFSIWTCLPRDYSEQDNMRLVKQKNDKEQKVYLEILDARYWITDPENFNRLKNAGVIGEWSEIQEVDIFTTPLVGIIGSASIRNLMKLLFGSVK